MNVQVQRLKLHKERRKNMSNKYCELMSKSNQAVIKAIQRKEDEIMSKFWKDMSEKKKKKALNLTIEEVTK